MSPHITVVPASTNVGRETIRVLLGSGRKLFIRGIYRDPSKALVEYTQNPNFEAAKGDVGDSASLDFSDSNAVFYIPPPTYDGTDTSEWAAKSAANVKDAIRRAPTVKKLILHSAVGAHHNHGIGVLRLNRISDNLLKTAASEVLIVKPGWYFEMFADALKMMKEGSPSFEAPFSPEDHQVPMVSVQDISQYCAAALVDESVNPGFREAALFGPRLYSSLDIKHAVEEVTGKQATMKVIKKENLVSWFEGQVPKFYAQEFADMVISILPGGTLEEDFVYGENTVRGKVDIVDALRCVA